jgi:hypothetical protein
MLPNESDLGSIDWKSTQKRLIKLARSQVIHITEFPIPITHSKRDLSSLNQSVMALNPLREEKKMSDEIVFLLQVLTLAQEKCLVIH